MIELAEANPVPEPPRLTGTVVLRATPDEAIDAAAADLLLQAHNCVRAFGDFHLAIAASESAEPFLRRLMYDPVLRELPWARTHLWVVADSRVGPDDPRCASQRLRELIVAPAELPPAQFHPIEFSTEDAAGAYQSVFQECLGWRQRGHDRLDYVFMASDDQSSPGGELFDSDTGPLVRSLRAQSGEDHVSFTIRPVRAARFVGVLAVGVTSAGLVGDAARRRRTSGPVVDAAAAFPASGLKMLGGELRWYLDHDACPKPDGTT